MNNTKLIAVALACAFAAGCSTAPLENFSSGNQQTGNKAGGNKGNGAKPKVVNLTPLSTYVDEWVDTANTPAGAPFSGAYTRLLIVGELEADQGSADAVTNLLYSQRPWLARALVGKEFSINLTANITVGTFESTVPLATIGHQSNSDGEQWSRVIHHSKTNFPLFLVKTDGSASVPVVKLSVNGTKSYASRGAAAAIQVALGVARATGQAPSVITRLSEQATKDKARAIDDAISKLFASGVTEEHWTDRDLRTWSASNKEKPRGVRIKFRIPKDEQDWNSEYLDVGTWTVTFDQPRPSIFSDWRICATNTLPRCAIGRPEAEKNVHKELDAGQVLNYKLVAGDQGLGTIRAFLSQQDWYISAQAGLASQSTANATGASFCRRIRNEITGLGLNGFDAEIVVWAVANGMPLPSTANLATVDDCKASITAVNNHRNRS